MSDRPPLLNEMPSGELGPRAVGDPYIIGGAVMLFSAVMNGVNGFLASRVNQAQGSGEYGPGWSPVGFFLYVAMGIGLFAGSVVARAVSLILMGIAAAQISGQAFNAPLGSLHFGTWPLYTSAGALIIGWALMLTPPARGAKTYVGAGMVVLAHGLCIWGLYL